MAEKVPDARAEATQFMGSLTRTARVAKTVLERALVEHGVHAGQQLILEALWQRDGRTPGELAAHLGIEVPTVTRGVQRMEASGLLARRAHPTDARLVRVTLTAQGRQLQAVLPGVIDAVTEQALAGLDATERRDVRQLLDRVARNLSDGH